MNLLKQTSYRTIYIILSAVLVFFIFLSTRTGAVDLSYGEIIDIVRHHYGNSGIQVNPIHEGLFFQIRLPRTVLCILVGASLSVSGALMQSLFRNPIVEPGL